MGKAAARPAGVAKYRDPQTGKTWTGNGKPPGLIAGAQNRDRFLINADPSAMEPATATALFEPKPSAKAARRKAAPATKAVTRQTPVKKALSRKPAEATAPERSRDADSWPTSVRCGSRKTGWPAQLGRPARSPAMGYGIQGQGQRAPGFQAVGRFVASTERNRGQLCTVHNPRAVHLSIGQSCSDKRSHFSGMAPVAVIRSRGRGACMRSVRLCRPRRDDRVIALLRSARPFAPPRLAGLLQHVVDEG